LVVTNVRSVCSYAAACSAAELSVYVTDIWIASDFFQFFLQFFLIFMKLGTHIYVPMHKKLERIFEILILKFLANFVNLELGLSLWNSRYGAIEAGSAPQF